MSLNFKILESVWNYRIRSLEVSSIGLIIEGISDLNTFSIQFKCVLNYKKKMIQLTETSIFLLINMSFSDFYQYKQHFIDSHYIVYSIFLNDSFFPQYFYNNDETIFFNNNLFYLFIQTPNKSPIFPNSSCIKISSKNTPRYLYKFETYSDLLDAYSIAIEDRSNWPIFSLSNDTNNEIYEQKNLKEILYKNLTTSEKFQNFNPDKFLYYVSFIEEKAQSSQRLKNVERMFSVSEIKDVQIGFFYDDSIRTFLGFESEFRCLHVYDYFLYLEKEFNSMIGVILIENKKKLDFNVKFNFFYIEVPTFSIEDEKVPVFDSSIIYSIVYDDYFQSSSSSFFGFADQKDFEFALNFLKSNFANKKLLLGDVTKLETDEFDQKFDQDLSNKMMKSKLSYLAFSLKKGEIKMLNLCLKEAKVIEKDVAYKNNDQHKFILAGFVNDDEREIAFLSLTKYQAKIQCFFPENQQNCSFSEDDLSLKIEQQSLLPKIEEEKKEIDQTKIFNFGNEADPDAFPSVLYNDAFPSVLFTDQSDQMFTDQQNQDVQQNWTQSEIVKQFMPATEINNQYYQIQQNINQYNQQANQFNPQTGMINQNNQQINQFNSQTGIFNQNNQQVNQFNSQTGIFNQNNQQVNQFNSQTGIFNQNNQQINQFNAQTGMINQNNQQINQFNAQTGMINQNNQQPQKSQVQNYQKKQNEQNSQSSDQFNQNKPNKSPVNQIKQSEGQIKQTKQNEQKKQTNDLPNKSVEQNKQTKIQANKNKQQIQTDKNPPIIQNKQDQQSKEPTKQSLSPTTQSKQTTQTDKKPPTNQNKQDQKAKPPIEQNKQTQQTKLQPNQTTQTDKKPPTNQNKQDSKNKPQTNQNKQNQQTKTSTAEQNKQTKPTNNQTAKKPPTDQNKQNQQTKTSTTEQQKSQSNQTKSNDKKPPNNQNKQNQQPKSPTKEQPKSQPKQNNPADKKPPNDQNQQTKNSTTQQSKQTKPTTNQTAKPPSPSQNKQTKTSTTEQSKSQSNQNNQTAKKPPADQNKQNQQTKTSTTEQTNSQSNQTNQTDKKPPQTSPPLPPKPENQTKQKKSLGPDYFSPNQNLIYFYFIEKEKARKISPGKQVKLTLFGVKKCKDVQRYKKLPDSSDQGYFTYFGFEKYEEAETALNLIKSKWLSESSIKIYESTTAYKKYKENPSADDDNENQEFFLQAIHEKKKNNQIQSRPEKLSTIKSVKINTYRDINTQNFQFFCVSQISIPINIQYEIKMTLNKVKTVKNIIRDVVPHDLIYQPCTFVFVDMKDQLNDSLFRNVFSKYKMNFTDLPYQLCHGKINYIEFEEVYFPSEKLYMFLHFLSLAHDIKQIRRNVFHKGFIVTMLFFDASKEDYVLDLIENFMIEADISFDTKKYSPKSTILLKEEIMLQRKEDFDLIVNEIISFGIQPIHIERNKLLFNRSLVNNCCFHKYSFICFNNKEEKMKSLNHINSILFSGRENYLRYNTDLYYIKCDPWRYPLKDYPFNCSYIFKIFTRILNHIVDYQENVISIEHPIELTYIGFKSKKLMYYYNKLLFSRVIYANVFDDSVFFRPDEDKFYIKFSFKNKDDNLENVFDNDVISKIVQEQLDCVEFPDVGSVKFDFVGFNSNDDRQFVLNKMNELIVDNPDKLTFEPFDLVSEFDDLDELTSENILTTAFYHMPFHL